MYLYRNQCSRNFALSKTTKESFLPLPPLSKGWFLPAPGLVFLKQVGRDENQFLGPGLVYWVTDIEKTSLEQGKNPVTANALNCYIYVGSHMYKDTHTHTNTDTTSLHFTAFHATCKPVLLSMGTAGQSLSFVMEHVQPLIVKLQKTPHNSPTTPYKRTLAKPEPSGNDPAAQIYALTF